jgi:hypothetical protein
MPLADRFERAAERGVALLENVMRAVDGSSERQFVSTRLDSTTSMTGFPAWSNVVMPESSTDPSQTSSNAPHETEPEYVNESANRSGGLAEAVPANSSTRPSPLPSGVSSCLPFPCSPPRVAPRTRTTMSRG